MRDDEHLLFFAHARSGSSSLYRILQSHPDLNLIEEPFNENFVKWHPRNKNYLSRIKDERSLDTVLDEIFEQYNGVKILEYQLGDLNRHLILRDDFRVIFLRRRNLLQAIVSLYIAEQTRLWKMWERDRPLEDYYRHLKPIDVDRIKEYLATLEETLYTVESLLTQRDRCLSLVYEDFYYADPSSRAAQLQTIWNLLDIPAPPSDVISPFLDPAEQKINSAETYRFIPNADEIEAACGSDRTGWLNDAPFGNHTVRPANRPRR